MIDVVLLDATTLIALGTIGELDLLTNFDGTLHVPERVANEVTTEPARTNFSTFLDGDDATLLHVPDDHDAITTATSILDADAVTGDVALLAGVVSFEQDTDVAVVSDDRRVRTISTGLGASVTGPIGVVVRAVHDGLSAEDGRALVKQIDSHGLHMTGELRETAYELVDAAADRD